MSIRQAPCDGRNRIATQLRTQVSSSYFAYRPVLQCLQSMQAVPLAEELVVGQGTQHAMLVPSDALESELQRLSTLDPSQRLALQQGLTQRVGLIQVQRAGVRDTFFALLRCMRTILTHASKETDL